MVVLLRWIETLGAFVVGLSTSYFVSQLYGIATATVFSVLGFFGVILLVYCLFKTGGEESGTSGLRQTLHSVITERDELKKQLEEATRTIEALQSQPITNAKQAAETPTPTAPQMPSLDPQPSVPDDKMTSMPAVKITRKEGELYEILKQRGKMKSAEIAGVVGRSQACVAVQLASLCEKGLVERDRDGFYYIKN